MSRRFEIGSQWIDIAVEEDNLRQQIRAEARRETLGMSEHIHVKINADDHALAGLNRKLERLDHRTVRIHVNMGNDDSMGKMDRQFAKVERFTDRFSKSTRMLNFSGINSVPLVSLGVAAAAASPLIVPMAASMLAASAATAAVIPAALGMGLAWFGLKQALSPVNDAMKEYAAVHLAVLKGTMSAAEASQKMNEILGRLRPSVRGLVVEMIRWKDEVLPGLIARLQDGLFPSITRLLDGLQGSVPILDRFFDQFSIGMARALDGLTAFTRSTLFGRQLQVMLDGSAVAFGRMAEAGVSGFIALNSIGAAATPVLIRFADWVAAAAHEFEMWIEMKRRSGELHAFFKMAADEASKWGQILGNFAGGVGALFVAALPAGTEMSTSILLISQHFRSWTSANTGQITEFFDHLRQHDWGGTIGGIAMAQAIAVIAHLVVWIVRIWKQISFLIEIFRILSVGGLAATAATGVGIVLIIIGLIALFYIMDPKFRAIINSAMLGALKMIGDSLERNREPLAIVSNAISFLASNIIFLAFSALGYLLGVMITTAGVLISTFITAFGWVVQLFTGMIFSWNDLAGMWSATWSAIYNFFTMIWGNISSFWVRAWDNLRNWFGGRLQDLLAIWSFTWTAISNFFGFIWANISQFWVRAWDNLRNWFGGRLADLASIWSITWTAMSNFFGFIWAIITNVWVKLWDQIRSFMGRTLEGIRGIWIIFWTSITNFLAIVWNKLADMTGKSMEDIRRFLFGALDLMKTAFGKMFGTIGNVLQSAWNSAKKGAAAAWNAIAAVFNGALSALNAVSSLFGFSVDWRFPTVNAANGGRIKKFGDGGRVGESAGKKLARYAFGGAVVGRVWAGGAAQGVSGAYALYHWAGGRGPLSSGFRPGAADWHGSGLAGDFAGFNQDGVASKLMTVGGGILEMIHSTNRANYGIKNGHGFNFGGGLWSQHKNHLHLAVTPPDASKIMGGKGIPIIGGILNAIGGFFKKLFDLIKDWLNPAKKIWDLMTAGIKVTGFIQGILKALAIKFRDKLLDWIGSLLNPGDNGGAPLVGADGTVIHQAYAQAKSMGASRKVMLALFEAGLVESGLRNLSFGDRDSQGFLQQRPSAGWGSILQIRNVPFATRSFVSRAQRIEGRYGTAGPLAQAVQVSAFPGRYAQMRGAAVSAIRREEPSFDPNGFAKGTSSASPGWHLVGEEGWEWMAFEKPDGVTSWNFHDNAIDIDKKTINDLNRLKDFKKVLDKLPQAARANTRMVT